MHSSPNISNSSNPIGHNLHGGGQDNAYGGGNTYGADQNNAYDSDELADVYGYNNYDGNQLSQQNNPSISFEKQVTKNKPVFESNKKKKLYHHLLLLILKKIINRKN